MRRCRDRSWIERRCDAPVVFVFTADEEVGCRGAELVGPELGGLLGELPMPGLCWIGEPTSYGICHTHKSIGSFEMKVQGRGGHSGAPAEGVNAIAVMGKVMDVIGKLQQERASSRNAAFAEAFPESPYDVLNFGTISGGIALNMIAEECRLRISYRSLPDVDPLELHREIERRVSEIDTRDWAGGPASRDDQDWPAADRAAAAVAARNRPRARAVPKRPARRPRAARYTAPTAATSRYRESPR